MKTLQDHDLEKVLDEKPSSATHYDTFYKCYLKVDDGDLMFLEDEGWTVSGHKDGINAVNNAECLDLVAIQKSMQSS